jgi:hypothetical protein
VVDAKRGVQRGDEGGLRAGLAVILLRDVFETALVDCWVGGAREGRRKKGQSGDLSTLVTCTKDTFRRT